MWKEVDKMSSVINMHKCYFELEKMKREALRAKRAQRGRDDAFCQFPNFIRLVSGEMGYRVFGKVTISDTAMSGPMWLKDQPEENTHFNEGNRVSSSLFRGVSYSTLTDEGKKLSFRADTDNINDAFNSGQRVLRQENEYSVPDTLAVFRRMCILELSDLTNDIKPIKKKVENSNTDGGSQPHMSSSTGGEKSRLEVFDPASGGGIVMKGSNIFSHKEMFTKRFVVPKKKL